MRHLRSLLRCKSGFPVSSSARILFIFLVANTSCAAYTCALILHQLELLGRSFSQTLPAVRSGLISLSSVPPIDYVLVPIGVTISVRALLAQQLVETVVWLLQLPRPPNLLFKAFLAALIGLVWILWSQPSRL